MQQARVGKNAFAGIYGRIEVDECMVSALMYKLAAPTVSGIINIHPMTDYYVCNNNEGWDQFGGDGEDAGCRHMHSGCIMTEECRGVNATVIMPHEPGSDVESGHGRPEAGRLHSNRRHEATTSGPSVLTKMRGILI